MDNTDKWGTDGYCVNLYEDRFLVNPPEDGCASFILKYEGDYVTIEYVDDDDTTTLYLSLVVDDANLRDKWSYFVTVSDDLTSSLWETNFVI